MKPLALILILVPLSLPALAQAQTQTNCQVFGNQINCTSSSPPVIQPVQPPQPLLTPEMINALAQKRAQEFAAAEAARRAAVEKFEAELSAPDVWTSLHHSHQYHVRMVKDHVYLEWIPDPNLPAGAHVATECQPSDGAWMCTSWADLPFPQKQRVPGTLIKTWGWKWCHAENSPSKLTEVSLERIQWEKNIFALEDFDVKTCRAKKLTRETDTLIPRQAPKP